MIPNDEPLRKQTIKRMLDKIMEDRYHEDIELTSWEEEFIDSIYEQFNNKGKLNTKQSEILERIYDK